MSIFIAYVLDGLILLPLGIVMFNRVAPTESIITLLIVLVLITPFTYRYSRVLWLHLDQWWSPR